MFQKPKRKYKYTTAKQIDGDDGYQWTILVNGKARITGLHKSEVAYYRTKIENEEEARRKPKR